MTDQKTFTLTTDQVKAIYEAGIRRGSDEQSASDWGSFPSGKKYDELVDAFYDITNKDVPWGEDGYKTFAEIEEWFK